MEFYKQILQYRRVIAGTLACGLALNKSLCIAFPETLYMPGYADLNSERISWQHMVDIINSTKTDLRSFEPIFPFVTNRSNSVSAGHFGLYKWTKQLPVVGVPKNYFCSNLFEVEELEVKLGKNAKPIYLDGGPNETAFLESLVFSESSQKFDVARQIFAIKSNWMLANIFLSPLFVAFGYILCFHGVKILRGKPFPRVLTFQVASVIVTYLVCRLAKNGFNYCFVKSMDQNAALVSEEYAQGALDYCSNLRKANKAARVLLGANGETVYDADGDYHDIFPFASEPSLVAREKYFKSILNSFHRA